MRVAGVVVVFSAAELQNGHWVTSRGRKTSGFLKGKGKVFQNMQYWLQKFFWSVEYNFINVVKSWCIQVLLWFLCVIFICLSSGWNPYPFPGHLGDLPPHTRALQESWAD